MTIRPRVGVAGISFVHDVPGSEEKLVETCSIELIQYLMSVGGREHHSMDWKFGPDEFSQDTVLTIMRQEAGK